MVVDRKRERREEGESQMEEELKVAIKEQYLGLDPSSKKKRAVVKPSEKLKLRFRFDWDESEDTSRDANALYQNPHQARPLFGRGLLAGIDRREQKAAAAASMAGTRDSASRRRPHSRRSGDPPQDQQHRASKRREDMTERDWRIFQEDFDISFGFLGKTSTAAAGSGPGPAGVGRTQVLPAPRPVRNWGESGLCQDLLKAVHEAAYRSPSPIQMAAIPLGLQRRDAIAIAETGSGKTAAFLLPILEYIASQSRCNNYDDRRHRYSSGKISEDDDDGPFAMVMTPTRELAQQIESEAVKLGRYIAGGVRVVCVVGGQPIEEQALRLSRGCDLLVATPGRLIDCLERRYVVLNRCAYVVLDEADRMMDMGFEPQVVRALDAMPSPSPSSSRTTTTHMFTATMRPAVHRVARKYLRDPVTATVGNPGKAARSIDQRFLMLTDHERLHELKRLLQREVQAQGKTAIVFCNSRNSADALVAHLEKAAGGYRVGVLHAGMSQERRQASLQDFRMRRFDVLVGTDLLGRGIDIAGVDHVINYEMPDDIESYTHRIGRTGRAGNYGVATSFLTSMDKGLFDPITQLLVDNNFPVPHFLRASSRA